MNRISQRTIIMIPIVIVCLACGKRGYEGSISESLNALPTKLPCKDFPWVRAMPYSIPSVTATFPAERVDSATQWVLLCESDIPFIKGIGNVVCGFNNQVVIVYHESIFDGYKWKLNDVSPNILDRHFIPHGAAWSPKHGLFLSTTNDHAFTIGLGAQGVCRITDDGRVERVFWPPFLRRWYKIPGARPVDNGVIVSDTPIWDTFALCFSSPDILWVGMLHGIIRLDLQNDKCIYFDDSNSPIQGRATIIAPMTGQDEIRCVYSEYSGESRFRIMPQKGRARIFHVSEKRVREEDIPLEAAEILNGHAYGIHAREGNIWFIGNDYVWKSSPLSTSRSDVLPSKACRHLLRDSSGYLWTAGENEAYVATQARWESITELISNQNEYKQLKITSLFEDPVGRIWVCWEYRSGGKFRGLATVLSRRGRKCLADFLGPPPPDT